LYPLLWSEVATKVNTESGLSRLACFSRTYRHLDTFLMVSFALPSFLSSHRTFSMLPLVVDSRHSVVEGWCAGRNPPSVQRRHSAKRATRASRRQLPGVYLPFHLAGQPFHRFTPNILNTTHASSLMRQGGRSVSAPLPRFSPCTLADAAMSAWWAEFPHAMCATAVRQLTNPKHE